jgi:hypothetical protein
MKRGLLTLLLALPCLAQAPDTASPTPAAPSAPPPTTRPAPRPVEPPVQAGTKLFGRDLPFFSPGSEILEWDGRHWNINNQRFFQARFEKYLNAPEETSEEDQQYQTLLRTILQKLAPDTYTPQNLGEAWRLLPQASNYTLDANLCDALADAVYSVWLAKRAQQQLTAANRELEDQRRQHEWNAQMAAQQETITAPRDDSRRGAGSGAAQPQPQQQSRTRDLRLQPHLQRLAEVNARLAANTAKREVSELQARIEFQALIAQFFLQRRFQHVLMATRFYRHLFSDGDTGLKVGKETQDLFAKGTGMPPTVGTLDALANEALRDVREGVKAFRYLLDQREMESATKRLAEAFLIGEYVPEIRTLPRDLKRQALEFSQKSNRLISALDVRDYALAETLIHDLETIAKDLDTAPARAAIETAKTVSTMHLAKAKNAAISGDRATLETELREATAIWPRNPALAEMSALIFSQADVQQKAIADLDALLSQRNYRQIFDDKLRFIAATALSPDRQEQLKGVLDTMQLIEATLARCAELAKRGDPAGAWESAEQMNRRFPDDPKLSQLRAQLTTEAADFVRALRTAQQLEDKNQPGASLAWYLKAQRLYPPSSYAQEGIDRLVKRIVPEN